MKTSKIGQVLLWIMAAVLSVSLFLLGSLAYEEICMYTVSGITYDDDYYEYTIDDGNYVHLLYMLENDQRSEDEKTGLYEEFAAIGGYYKAASLYHAYMAVEDTDSAAIQKGLMERYKENVKEYEEHIDLINALFDL